MCVSHVVCIGKKKNTYKILVVKLEENGPLGRPKCRWESNVKMDVIVCELVSSGSRQGPVGGIL
jgi:hypothetical protein